MDTNHIATLDIGTTSLRCYIFNSAAQVVGFALWQIKLVYPKPGYVEIDPDDLWKSTLSVIQKAIANAGLTSSAIKCLGISTLRSTFTTWRKSDGKPFHNFITWKDMRANNLVKKWNDSILMKSFRLGSYCLYLFSRSKRFLTGSRLKFGNTHTSLRLLWVLENVPQVQQAVLTNDALFGTIDSWLIYKFTSGKVHVTDVSNASATGLYDPFDNDWGIWTIKMLKLPTTIFPKVVSNDFEFGVTDVNLFGCKIPIKCVIGDQSASMFGSCCFGVNDLKVTLGTGCFLNVNTGEGLHTSALGMYPLIGWEIENKAVYIAEAACNDTGSLIEWGLNIGLAADPTETGFLANHVKDTDGVYFIPAFSGLGPPINDQKAASGFLGVKPTTTKSHMVRAILESIVYRVVLTYDVLKQERNASYRKICIDGGVSKNNFVCQLIADMTGIQVERATWSEMTTMGVVFIAGLSSGIWNNIHELQNLRMVEHLFIPNDDESVVEGYKENMKNWLRAVDRFKTWYNVDE